MRQGLGPRACQLLMGSQGVEKKMASITVAGCI